MWQLALTQRINRSLALLLARLPERVLSLKGGRSNKEKYIVVKNDEDLFGRTVVDDDDGLPST